VRHWDSLNRGLLWDADPSLETWNDVSRWVMKAVTKKRDFVIRDMLHDHPGLARERLLPEKTTESTASTTKAFLLGHIPRDLACDANDHDKACCTCDIRNYVLKILVGDGTVDNIARQCGVEGR